METAASTSKPQAQASPRCLLWLVATPVPRGPVGLSLSEYRRTQALTRKLTRFASFRELLMAQHLFTLSGYRTDLALHPAAGPGAR